VAKAGTAGRGGNASPASQDETSQGSPPAPKILDVEGKIVTRIHTRIRMKRAMGREVTSSASDDDIGKTGEERW